MKNVVGPIPRKEDFFPRPRVINKIYRRLDAGSNLYLAAPRRAGKTAIMCYLEDEPREKYEFQYLITEAVDHPITYFRMLLDSFKEFESLSQKSMKAISNFLGRFSTVEVFGFKVELNKQGIQNDVSYFEEFKRLLKSIETKDGTKIVVMIDEFPQTVENILREHGAGEAEQFLQFNRELRHQENRSVNFIFTGSIGLPTLAEKLNATKEINDLNIVEVPPLERDQAQMFVRKLLDTAKISCPDAARDYLLDRVEWYIPFYIQLAIQELIDEYEKANTPVNDAMIGKAFANISKSRNNIYFEHYYSRLKDAFDEQEYPFAIAVLKMLSRNDVCGTDEIKTLAMEYQLDKKYQIVLRSLEFDGYLFKKEVEYQFTSPILRQWWRNYVV